jgi:hypothetical protein
MANELAGVGGVPVTLQFALANPSANATTDMTLAGGQGATTFLVPTGHKFRPLYLYVASNADLTAGTLTAKVHVGGTEIASGPEPVLSDEVQSASAVVGLTNYVGVAAGSTVGVSVTTTAAYAPTTADIDAVLVGVFLPA